MKIPKKKATRIERTDQKKKIVEYYQAGSGMYIFRNRSQVASLELPKTSADGKKWIPPGQTWRGDSYFLKMVPREAILVESIGENKEDKMQEKLILDQPDQVTSAGKIEHAASHDNIPINEDMPHKESETKERLINEDPLSGVTIIRD